MRRLHGSLSQPLGSDALLPELFADDLEIELKLKPQSGMTDL